MAMNRHVTGMKGRHFGRRARRAPLRKWRASSRHRRRLFGVVSRARHAAPGAKAQRWRPGKLVAATTKRQRRMALAK